MYCSSKNQNSKTCVYLDQGFTFDRRRIRRRLLLSHFFSTWNQHQKKLLTAGIMAVLLAFNVDAQILQPTAGTTTLTAGTDFATGDLYYDSGGSAGDYSNSESGTLEFCANPGEEVIIDFTAFEVEASGGAGGQCWDQLTVTGDSGGGDDTYAGDTFDLGPGLACNDATNFFGDPTLGPFISADGGCLSFFFDSDANVTQSGWEANITVQAAGPVTPCVITAPTTPSITVQLDGSGSAFINAFSLILNAGITTGPGCNRFRLYTDPTTWVDRFVLSPVPFTVYDCSGGPNGVGTYTYSIYADDDNDPSNGQAGPVSLEVIVVDNEDPFIACPAGPYAANTSTGTNDDCRAPVAGLTHPLIADNCSGATLEVTYANANQPMGSDISMMVTPGDPNLFEFYLGTTTVSYQATDASGNTSPVCSFDVTITDDEKPDWVEPAVTGPITSVNTNGNGRTTMNVVLDCQSPTFAADLATWLAFVPSATDECDDMLMVMADGSPSVNTYATCSTVNGVADVQQRTVLRFKVTDASGNSRQQSNGPSDHFRLRIYEVDQTPPSVDAMTGITNLVGNGGTLTLNTDMMWNPTMDADACQINLNAAGAPDISISNTDCNSVTTTKTITGGPVGFPMSVNAAGNNAAGVYAVGTYTITYDMEDHCGNMTSFSFTLEVEDKTGPVITGMPGDINIPDTDVNECSAEVEWPRPSASDCSGLMSMLPTAVGPTGQAVLIFTSGNPANDIADFDVGTSTVYYTAIDAMNNVSVDSFKVTVTDDTAPTISCSGPITLPTVCATATVPDYAGFTFPADNCAGVTVIQMPSDTSTLQHLTLSSDVGPPGPSDGDQFIVTFQAQDANGNFSPTTCSITVTLQDNDLPTPTVDPLPTLDDNLLVGAGCGSITVAAPTAVDCNGVVYHGTPSFANGNPAPNFYTFDAGAYIITWTISDGSGNVLTQLQSINVSNDSVNPSVEAPADDTEDTDAGDCTLEYDISLSQVFPPATGPYDPSLAVNSGTYKDNCGITSITYELSGATTAGPNALGLFTEVTLNKGTTTITYVAMDAAGNSGSDSFTVTVEDNEDPMPSCTNYFSNEMDGTGDAVSNNCAFDIGAADTSYDPTVTDNCGPVTKTILSVTPSFWGTGTYTAGASNSSLAGATFSVDSEDGFEWFDIIWEFEDADGNSTTCTQLFDVFDTADPGITCQDDDPATAGNQINRNTSDDGFGDCGYYAQGSEFDIAGAADNCAVADTTNSINGTATLAGEYFPTGTTTVTWTITDHSGNSSSCDVDIIITDDEEPSFSCLPGLVVPLPSSNVYTLNPFSIIIFYPQDNCNSIASIVAERIDGTAPAPAVFECADATNTPIPIRIIVTDDAGNFQTCTTTITIQENVEPKAVCQPVTLYLDANGDATLNPADMDAGSTDNCMGSLTFSASQTAFDCDDLGTNTVTMTATDPSNNSHSCSDIVTVIDNLAPVVMCQSVNAYLDASGVVTVDAIDFDNGTTDNAGGCGTLTYMINGTAQKSYNCSDVGSHTITLEVTDPSGNSATCTTTVVVIDDIDPTAQCQDFTVYLDNMGTVTVLATDLDAGSSDNCPGTLSFDIDGDSDITFTCDDMGMNAITLTVTDVNGNSSTCVSNIEVLPYEEVDLTINQTSGPAGSTAFVSVTIDKAPDMRSIQFSLDIGDASVATIVGATSTLPGYTANVVNSTRVAFTWFDTNNMGVDFAPDDEILSVEVLLVGVENDITTASFGNSPTVIEITQGCGLVPYITTVNTFDDQILINANTSVVLEGRIATEDDDPLVGTFVQLSGDETGFDWTDANGEYSFTVPSGSNVDITPYADNDVTLGVTALDLAIIQSHIVNGGILMTPYKHIAANPLSLPTLSMGITTADLSLIQGQIVSSSPTFQPYTSSFRFVDAAYTFANGGAPWLESWPESISTSSAVDQTNLDFVAIKMGDVNDTWPNATGFGADGEDRSAAPGFLIEDRSLKAGKTYSLDFRANNFEDLIALQAGLKFDGSSLEILSAKPAEALINFPVENIGLDYLDQDLISVIWYHQDALSLENETILFSLEVQAKRNIESLEEVLVLNSEILASDAYASDHFSKGFSLNFKKYIVEPPVVITDDAFGLIGNRPNPFKDQTVISVILPEAEPITLSILDATGKVIFTKKQDGIKGLNEITISGNDIQDNGVLNYQIATPTQSAMKRMVRVN